MKCPICNNECNTEVFDTLDGRPVGEENECADCSYRHRRIYVYGYTTIFIGDTIVSLNLGDSKEVTEQKKKTIETAIQKAKKEMNKE